jgi:hypothetical protein
MKSAWMLAFAFGVAAIASAQEQTAADVARLKMKMAAEIDMQTKIAAVEGKVTPGAPYSAEAVNESTQTLADGNRIVQRSVTRVYRDGEGRTRREEVAENGDLLHISIVDPVAHASYVLDPKTRTAYQGTMLIATPRVFVQGIPGTAADKRATEAAAAKMRAADDMKVRMAPPLPPPPPPPGYKGDMMNQAAHTNEEDLGRQTVEGVSATGSRTSWTIPAGAIGNMQPIKIVSEQWFAPDLQLLVLTKHSDPRTGENVYRLQNIVRAEPDRSLFSVPPDYTLRESGIRKE